MIYPIHYMNTGPYGVQQPPAAVRACVDPCACKMKTDGKGVIQVRPDTAIVTLGVSTESKQLQTAQQENAEIAAKVLNALKSAGISAEDIQTRSYSVQPQYDYIDGRQVLRGYQVVHMFRVFTDAFANVGMVIDSAVNAGANIIEGIEFTLKDPAPYYKQALEAAIEDCVLKAMTIGRKLGVNVIPKPMQLTEKRTEYAVPFQPMLASAPQVSTPIQAGQLEVTAEIEAVFGYYR